MTKKPSELNFSVIIPNYNGAKFLPDCLNSLLNAINNCPEPQFELILVDNNSKDNSIEIFEKIIPKSFNYRILLNSKNRGFAGAINQGIEKAKHKYVVLLNNDLTIEKNWFQLISKTIKANKNPKVATFFGTVLNKDGSKFESQGLDFFYSGKCQNISNGEKFDAPSFLQGRGSGGGFVWGASAALVVYKKEILEKIGLFDADFFAYEEDVDLALRLHNLNYQTLYIPKALSYHLGGGTSNKMGVFRYKMDAKNWIYIIIKNFSAKEIANNLLKIIEERLRNLSGLSKKVIRLYKLKSIFYLPYVLISVYGTVLINLSKMFNKRKVIQKLVKLHNSL
ncbi:MAG: glycosyltransferase family 2 protein [Candidatus Shapirobacteria bacterium]|nr:glycosyltransferase family 2 protein [Candidatus Shapirobacteria bacterium]MDD4410493.1 glycosyltransferase family 2 protein [Candidatus Shapirobacteria bacterium]